MALYFVAEFQVNIAGLLSKAKIKSRPIFSDDVLSARVLRRTVSDELLQSKKKLRMKRLLYEVPFNIEGSHSLGISQVVSY